MHGQRRTAFSAFLMKEGYIPKPEDYVWLADWRRYKLPYCSIYVVAPDGNWPCKVGISTNPYKRLIGLQTSVWKPLKVTSCYWAKTIKEARELEKQVHKRLTSDNVWLHGEWFDMRPKDAREMIEFVSMVEGLDISDQIDNEEVMQDLRSEIAGAMDNDFHRMMADVGKHKTFNYDDLANVANQYSELGMVMDPALEQMVKDHHYEDERRKLPSLKVKTS